MCADVLSGEVAAEMLMCPYSMFICNMAVVDLSLRNQMASKERHTVWERQGWPPDPQQTRQPLQNNQRLCPLRKAAGYKKLPIKISYIVEVLIHESLHEHARTQQ